MTGGVLSILTVTESELLRPALFVGTQVRIVPAVSRLRTVSPHPDAEAIPDSGSLTVQLTLTLSLLQPLTNEGFTEWVMTGGVESLEVTGSIVKMVPTWSRERLIGKARGLVPSTAGETPEILNSWTPPPGKSTRWPGPKLPSVTPPAVTVNGSANPTGKSLIEMNFASVLLKS